MSFELLQLLLLIITANASPILIREVLCNKYHTAVDFGQSLPDRKRIFGDSKTWRGIIASLLLTSFAAWLLVESPLTGLLIAIFSVLGDLTSSFIKRRMGMPASSMALLLDQLPESLFPAIMLRHSFNLDTLAIIILALLFVVAELVLSYIFYKWGIRKKPY